MNENINSTTPIISVIMSVYNGELYLREAIDSILNQTFTQFELIIINDGSKDNSISIIKSYNDKRIVLIDNDGNKGLIYSLNKGIEVSKGKYIARMDADDISLPERLNEQYLFLEKNNQIGVCGCDYTQFTSNNKSKKYAAFHLHDEILGNMFFNCSVIHPSLMIRTSLLKNEFVIYNSSFSHAEDYELWSRLIFKTHFSAVNKLLFEYRIHNSQITQIHNSKQANNANVVRKNMLDNAGFKYSSDEFIAHCNIGSSIKIKTKKELKLIEQWLISFYNQNKTLKIVDEDIFKKIIAKQWIDSCGNTSLGLSAVAMYYKSTLAKYHSGDKLKLIIKSIVRKFS